MLPIFAQVIELVVAFETHFAGSVHFLRGNMSKSYEKQSLFRQLHQGPSILVLPNAWDVASAKIFSAVGFPAIATTSAGIANCLGYADGEIIPMDEMLFISSLVKNIPGPINILAVANTPPTEVLEKLGARRVSTGSGPARACATLARRIGRELIDQGNYSSFTHDAMTYKEMNSLFPES